MQGAQAKTDIQFGIQVVLIGALAVPMAVRHLYTVEGVSLGFIIALFLYGVFMTSMSIGGYRALPDRKAKQTLFIFGSLTLLTALDVVIIAIGGMYAWDLNDTVTIASLLIGAAAVMMVRGFPRDFASDPITKSQLAIVTRLVPQVLQGSKIFLYGGAGFPGVVLVAGNVGMWLRLAFLFQNWRAAPEELNRRWLLFAELANVLSWGMVTIVWTGWALGFI